jgi:3-methyl-2-oxobutanoate hydroxymethyltransferase
MKLEAHHIRALKGQRQLVQINVSSAEQAEAAEAAGGIDIIVNGEKARWSDIRRAAPHTHLCLSLRHGEASSRSDVLRQAFAALEAGADSIYCSLSPRFIEAMAGEGIPVCAHAGLLPPKARLTGMRGFAKTEEEAKAVFRAVKDFEAAGATMVELECVAAPITALITPATTLTTVSIGSGGGADVQYLFGCDILGEPGFRPRHARAFDDFAAEYARLQERRIAAFAAFRDAVVAGTYPGTSEVLTAPEPATSGFADWLQKIGQETPPE